MNNHIVPVGTVCEFHCNNFSFEGVIIGLNSRSYTILDVEGNERKVNLNEVEAEPKVLNTSVAPILKKIGTKYAKMYELEEEAKELRKSLKANKPICKVKKKESNPFAWNETIQKLTEDKW